MDASQEVRGPAPAPLSSPLPAWAWDHYVIREKGFTLGRQYRVFDNAGNLLAFCRQKMFKLKEDIRFYDDEAQGRELFRLQATQVLDWSGNFDVVEADTGRRLGSLRRRGWKSLVRDEWHVVDEHDRPWGRAIEDSWTLSLLRRATDLLPDIFGAGGGLIPNTYHLERATLGAPLRVGYVKERFQIFGDTYDLALFEDPQIDRRVLVGLAVCLDAIEGE